MTEENIIETYCNQRIRRMIEPMNRLFKLRIIAVVLITLLLSSVTILIMLNFLPMTMIYFVIIGAFIEMWGMNYLRNIWKP
jgi:hypothetical protein